MLGQFSQAEALLMKAGVQPGTFDGVLMDLGCSSMQLNTHERDFSLWKGGPLDMRMDDSRSTGACMYPENIQGGKACQENCFSNCSGTQHLPQQLASIVAGAFPLSAINARKDLLQRSTHIATKTFQALRIFVNNELNELYTGLKTAQKFLRPGGHLVTVSFHSLQDSTIKRTRLE
ncbi:hypothetical protein H8959_015713 [Pygathrix nigripes]